MIPAVMGHEYTKPMTNRCIGNYIMLSCNSNLNETCVCGYLLCTDQCSEQLQPRS